MSSYDPVKQDSETCTDKKKTLKHIPMQ